MILSVLLSCSVVTPPVVSDTGAASAASERPAWCDTAADVTWEDWGDGFMRTQCQGCHASDTAAGGVTFETAGGSHGQLTGQFDGVAYALAGDPACSVLVQVVESDDPEVVMPPSGKLPAAERCAIIQWVANGAER